MMPIQGVFEDLCAAALALQYYAQYPEELTPQQLKLLEERSTGVIKDIKQYLQEIKTLELELQITELL